MEPVIRARRAPIAAKWQGPPEVIPMIRTTRPMMGMGVGSRGRKSNGPERTPLSRRDANQAAFGDSQGSARPQA